MQSQELLTRVRQMAEEVSAREGCTVYDIELVGGGQGRILRVFIEKSQPKPEADQQSQTDLDLHHGTEASGVANSFESPEFSAADNDHDHDHDHDHEDEDELEASSPVANTSISTDEGVSIRDCSNVSRGLNLLLDVEDIIPGGRYDLEVSSPGVERVLREPWHFERVIGKTILVKTFAPLVDFNQDRLDLARTRQLQTQLLSVVEQGIEVLAGESKAFVPFEAITKAHLVFEFGGATKAGPNGKNKAPHPKGKGPKKKKR